jgi:hypothetical protein
MLLHEPINSALLGSPRAAAAMATIMRQVENTMRCILAADIHLDMIKIMKEIEFLAIR